MSSRRVVEPAITLEAYRRQEAARQPKKPPTRGTPDDGPRRRGTGTDWMADAPCRGKTDLFFVERAEPGDPFGDRTAAAKAICATCPYKAECKALWLGLPGGQQDYGVWFGKAGRQRRLAREMICQRCADPFERSARSKTMFCHPCRYLMRAEAVRAANARRGPGSRTPIEGVKHGTRDGYRNKACRCAECCAWQAERRKKSADRKKDTAA